MEATPLPIPTPEVIAMSNVIAPATLARGTVCHYSGTLGTALVIVRCTHEVVTGWADDGSALTDTRYIVSVLDTDGLGDYTLGRDDTDDGSLSQVKPLSLKPLA